MADGLKDFPDELQHLSETEEILKAQMDVLQGEISKVDGTFREAMQNRADSYYDMDTRERLQMDRILKEIQSSMGSLRRSEDHLRKLMDSPYFARIDFAENGVLPAVPLYIGRFNFMDREEILIYDWRAPVSSMFYDHDTGPAFYDAPIGRIEGLMTLKRQFRIKDGKADYVTDTAQTVSDDVLQEELAHTSDDRMKTIIATIQREQNAVIRNEKTDILVIQGAAGSGKTSIALHRIAFLLYRFRGRIKAQDIMILSPSTAFSDYISDVIPELGEEPIREYSFYELAVDALDSVIDFDDPSDPLDQADPGWQERARFKSSPEFLSLLRDYVKVLPERVFSPADFVWDGVKVDADWIMEQFLFYRYDPVYERLQTITDETVEEYRQRAGLYSDIPKRGLVYNKLRSMLVIRSPQALYKDFYRFIRRPDLLRLKKNRLEWPDVFPFLFLWHAYKGLDRHRNIRHLIVDEMQDYTPVQYEVLNIMYPCRKTILGDYGQCMDPYNVSTLTDLLGCYPSAQFAELRKSYRSTKEIMDFASSISAGPKPEVIDRHGEAPRVMVFPDEETEMSFLLSEIESFRERKSASLAIILKTGREAEHMYKKLSAKTGDITLLDAESKHFEKGVSVTSVRISKGLEFDEVLIPGADGIRYKEAHSRNLLYIAATRAMHRLTLTAAGSLSPWIPGCSPEEA